MAILDGRTVTDETIDPGLHRFIGTFRPPVPPSTKGVDAIICPCQKVIWTKGELFEHWQIGHFDAPQYVTISGDEAGKAAQ